MAGGTMATAFRRLSNAGPSNACTGWQRSVCTTSVRQYPRQLVSRRSTPGDGGIPTPPRPAIHPDKFQPTTASTSKDVPWYLREREHVQEERRRVRFRLDESEAMIKMDESLPAGLQGLHALLTTGAPSPLVARPDEEDVEMETGRRPIVFIDAKKKDEQAWTDWIVVVQVRTSSGSAVSRVAREIGHYLRTAPLPMAEVERQAALEAAAAKEAKENRPWRPMKILSREAQDGLRLLHANDPERWSRKALAQTFKMSVESVRRVLKSKWQPPSDVVARQNRRARERQEERRAMFATQGWQGREGEEIERIRASIAQAQGEGANDGGGGGGGEALDPDEYALEGAEEKQQHVQPIRYEGLVGSSNDVEAVPSKAASRARSGVSRGDGEWCLVDAGWCVVHVMTAKARMVYDVERPYLKKTYEDEESDV